ncbi:MAG TPA: class I SAM-dependent methyltransferase [Gaiellaceae bacterium]|nr:class I SAM-dependent methyltransferase [Gaiellaceae bacterium]
MSLWRRAFAAGYDRATAGAERGALGDARRELVGSARGRVLEIGAGTGANLPHYPGEVDVVLSEPDPQMAKRLRAKSGALRALEASADALPFSDDSFDTVVATLVFCSVPDVPAALREVRRVLAPGGHLLFLEHVRGQRGSKLERWQDRVNRPWRALACGCNCNRDFVGHLRAAGFTVDAVRHEAWPFMPAVVRPVVVGSAS